MGETDTLNRVEGLEAARGEEKRRWRARGTIMRDLSREDSLTLPRPMGQGPLSYLAAPQRMTRLPDGPPPQDAPWTQGQFRIRVWVLGEPREFWESVRFTQGIPESEWPGRRHLRDSYGRDGGATPWSGVPHRAQLGAKEGERLRMTGVVKWFARQFGPSDDPVALVRGDDGHNYFLHADDVVNLPPDGRIPEGFIVEFEIRQPSKPRFKCTEFEPVNAFLKY